MLILNGTLRQAGEMEIDGRKLVKVWVEHESPRGEGRMADLRIEELFLEKVEGMTLPTQGKPVSVAVRAYPKGKDIAFSAIALVPAVTVPPLPSQNHATK